MRGTVLPLRSETHDLSCVHLLCFGILLGKRRTEGDPLQALCFAGWCLRRHVVHGLGAPLERAAVPGCGGCFPCQREKQGLGLGLRFLVGGSTLASTLGARQEPCTLDLRDKQGCRFCDHEVARVWPKIFRQNLSWLLRSSRCDAVPQPHPLLRAVRQVWWRGAWAEVLSASVARQAEVRQLQLPRHLRSSLLLLGLQELAGRPRPEVREAAGPGGRRWVHG
mmetsp:Transcript_117975/g.376132  ORF Transcript_117975/g.376132 Transcript_117975/m.376132 type:complete len:222 (+) Transcript_117975:41-706(+)